MSTFLRFARSLIAAPLLVALMMSIVTCAPRPVPQSSAALDWSTVQRGAAP